MNGKNEISTIKMADVIPTPDNPRHITKDDPKVQELAESIKGSGLLYPVICRPHPKQKGKYDLRAGFRRFLAHQILKADTILAIVREMDDRQALEVTVLENLQRENLTPLEEARGVKALMDSGQSLCGIGAEIGKTVAWVARRAKLVDLVPEAVKMVEDPKSVWHKTTAGHLELIARLPAERQRKLIDEDRHDLSLLLHQPIKELAESLAREEMLISAAGWDPAACAGCIKRTDVAPELFQDDLRPEAIKKRARCLDPVCWKQKEAAFLQAKVAALKDKHGDSLVIVGGWEYQGRDAQVKRTHSEYDVEPCKQSAPGARPALILDKGKPREGWVRVKAGAKEMASKQPPLAMRRKAWIIKHVEKALMAKDTPCPFQSMEHAAVFVAWFGTQSAERYAGTTTGLWEKMAAMRQKTTGREIQQKIWEQVRPVLKARLRYFQVGSCNSEYKDAIYQAVLLGLGDEAALNKLAEGALPGKKEKVGHAE